MTLPLEQSERGLLIQRTHSQLIETSNNLRDALQRGQGIVEQVWSYNTRAWAKSVHAADIDGDGDIEILIGSRDGYIHALTKRKALKWRTSVLHDGVGIEAVAGITRYSNDTQVQVLAGARNGMVYGLDYKGVQRKEFQASERVRYLYVDPDRPDHVIVGCDDHSIHVLQRETLQPIIPPLFTEGSIRSVFSYDIDGNGENEIFVASSDLHIYVFSLNGELRAKIPTGDYKVCALCVAPLDAGEITLLASTSNKELAAWSLASQQPQDQRLSFQKKSLPLLKEQIFAGRIYTIRIIDMNKDKFPEVLIATENGFIYILDRLGKVLWKHALEQFITQIFALDIDFDGMVEVLVGMEDNNVQMLRVDLNKENETRYEDILTAYRNFSHKESQLLYYLTDAHKPPQEYQYMEWNWVELLIAQRRYEDALLLLSRLRKQKFQHLWSAPITCKGSIRTIDSGNFIKDEVSELTIGTENGYVEIIDIMPSAGEQIISKCFSKGVSELKACITTASFEYILVGSDDHRVYLVDNELNVVKEILSENEGDKASTLYAHKYYHEHNCDSLNEIIIGYISGEIHIYDSLLAQRLDCVRTAPGLYLLCTTDTRNSQIITVSAKHYVNAYTRDGEWRWCFERIRDRVRGIYAGDIDKDGFTEVVLGSEDCSVYVLDYNGNLKWRYLTPHRILALEVADINGDNCVEILLGVEDGYMYVLNNQGDLLWTYKANDRVTAIHARDLHEDAKRPDGRVEIAVASDGQLDLLQSLDSRDIFDMINLCWHEHQEQLYFNDRRKFILERIRHRDANIHILALAKLAGSEAPEEDLDEDLQQIEAVLDDTSLEVRLELARTAVNLKLSRGEDPKVVALVRKIFQILSIDQRREVRLTLVARLHHLDNTSLCFEYLERLSNNEDAWVRRAVIRALETLMKKHPREVFELLLKAAKAYKYSENETLSDDEKDWILQETGRSLAHYFDIHQDRLFSCIRDLIAQGSSLQVIQQIAYSSPDANLRSLFSVLVQVMRIPDYTDDQTSNAKVEVMLEEAVKALRNISQPDVIHSKGILLLYEELRQLFRVRAIEDIEQYSWITDTDLIESASLSSQAAPVFKALYDVIENIRRYRKRRVMGERLSALIHAYDILMRLQAQVEGAETERMKQAGDMAGHPKHLSCPPEDHLLICILKKWLAIVLAKIEHVRGRAILRVELRNKNTSWNEEQLAISLQIDNQGHCPAENVQVELEESSEFEIIGSRSFFCDEIGETRPAKPEFTIRPLARSPRLTFRIDYTDAEGARTLEFADELKLETYRGPFKTIPNKYRIGKPLKLDDQDRELFFGRKKDIHILQEKLTTDVSNSLVVLSGQRRSGKTSLLYQLMGEINTQTEHQAIVIDLQGLALKDNVAQLLKEFAHIIVEALHEKGMTIFSPDDLDFAADPTAAFDHFLRDIRLCLGARKLILLIDEFEVLQEKIEQQQISANLLKYLRSLVQHRQGISLLFAGAPKIRHLTEWYWAAFFNIAHTHVLSKLEAEDAEELVTRPVSRYLKYDDLAVEKLHHLTNDQPYLIHLLCATLIQHCNKKQKNYVTVNDVNVVCDQVIATQNNYFNWIWNQLQNSSVERLVISTLAQIGEDDYVSPGSIRASLESLEYQISQKQLMEALNNLLEEEFIEQEPTDTYSDGGQYRIPTGLTRAWLRTVKPLEWVDREMPSDEI